MTAKVEAKSRESIRTEWVIFAAFFMSGCCGLIYEVVWARWLDLIFGVSAYAVAAVVASMMAGLGLGSLILGRLADRVDHPLRLCGWLELSIAAYALLIPWLLVPFGYACAKLSLVVPKGTLANTLLVFSGCLLLLLVPTVLMGGTLPVLCRALIRKSSHLVRGVGLLYGLNTLGAVCGCFISGFILIPWLGLRATAAVAISGNILIGALLLLRSKGMAIRLRMGARRKAAPAESARGKEALPASGLLLVAAASGFIALGYEVLWFRVLKQIIGSTVYAFSTMLGTFLIGLSLGSLLAGYAAERGKSNLLCWLALAQALAGLCTVLTFPAFSHSWDILAFFSEAYFSHIASWEMGRLIHFAIAAFVMLPPALFLGVVFPIISRMYAARMENLGEDIGTVYFSNTVGSVLGSVLVGFILLPYAGVRQSLSLLAGCQVILGLGLLIISWRRVHRHRLFAAGSFAVLSALFAGLAFITQEDVFIDERNEPNTLYFADGAAATVRVYRNGDRKVLATDDLHIQGSSSSYPHSHPKRLGYLPILIHPKRNLAEVLQIGLGTGINLSALAEGPVRGVDVVEIIPEVVEAAGYFKEENADILADPRVRLIIDDGRNYVLSTRKRYDLIVGDLFFPENAGSSSLYSLEHFRRCRDILSAEGMMVQWVPLHQVSMEDFKIIARTFVEAFPHASLWWGTASPTMPVVGLVGTKSPQTIDLASLTEKFEPLSGGLREVFWDSPLCVLSNLILDDERLRAFSQGAPLNTDDHPLVEFSAPKAETESSGIIRGNILALAGQMAAGRLSIPALDAHIRSRSCSLLRMVGAAPSSCRVRSACRDYTVPSLPGRREQG